MGVISVLQKVNSSYPWSHNDFYHRWICSELPVRRDAALDVGCGGGSLLVELSPRFGRVDGVEPERDLAAATAARVAALSTVSVSCAGFVDVGGIGRYDLITMVAVLHHMPLEPSLDRAEKLLKPGGRLVVVGCYRAESRADRVVGILALVANPMVGFVKNRGRRPGRLPDGMMAPTADPVESLADIRTAAQVHLPGSRITRRLFWRYSLLHTKPAGPRPRVGEIRTGS
ncbi:SAM-dependent methyltransferase [Nakamurella sp. UYEF19]|uniref:class I SAM-dependent methyltransferase n=1 Tax=Nakamurella sp. UYEF19 TaxID=1756392 RepID=UPI00339688CE